MATFTSWLRKAIHSGTLLFEVSRVSKRLASVCGVCTNCPLMFPSEEQKDGQQPLVGVGTAIALESVPFTGRHLHPSTRASYRNTAGEIVINHSSFQCCLVISYIPPTLPGHSRFQRSVRYDTLLQKASMFVDKKILYIVES